MSQLLIYLHNIFKSFGPKKIFDGISLSVSRGECFALVGENGSGKTTLLRLLASVDTPDDGVIERAKELSIGYLCQEASTDSLMRTVREYLFNSLHQIEQKMESLQDRLDDPTILEEWAALHGEFERRGGYRSTLDEMVNGLSLQIDLDRSLETLSCGERRRIDLAKVLLDNPDLLLLDEPTNHLDSDSIIWLKEHLRQRKGATIIVSHDRRFINDTCNRLIELKNQQLTRFGGNYDFYVKECNRLIEQQIRAFEEQQEERSSLVQQIRATTFSKGKPSPPKDRNIMAYDRWGEHHQRSVKHRLDQMKERLEKIDADLVIHPRPKSITGIVFHDSSFSAPIAIEWEHLSKSFDGKVVFEDQTNALQSNERLVLTGPNGSGKTTLFKCFLKQLIPDAGTIRINPSVRIGYLDQDGEMLPEDQTPLEYFSREFGLNETLLRSELHKTGLDGSDLLLLPFKRMSSGQRKRLMILSLILTKPNVILLDEPTNHLDLLTLEALETALMNFSGAILAISHDATFAEKIATRQILMKND
jgi:ATP-binding cassette, subfamily F, member 3